MKEITVQEAIGRKYLLIDMKNSVAGYDGYDFHAGNRCKVNGFPYQIMAEDGRFSLAAEAVALTKWKRKPEPEKTEFQFGEKVAVICLNGGNTKAFEMSMQGNRFYSMQSIDLM